MTRVGVDVMGGDHAPSAVIDGVMEATKTIDSQIVLVGPKDVIEQELSRFPSVPENIEIHHAPDVIGMGESPALSVRKKPESSICQLVKLAKAGEVDAIVSAGNTGAMVCASTLGLGLLEGISRPGIGTMIPTLAGVVLVLDVGANIDPKPEHLYQYGIMGSVYLRHELGREKPKIGLLNIGEEASKGTEFVRQVFKLLEDSDLNFIGNIEGRDIYSGKADLVVTDGFVGNIALKVSESMASGLVELFKREVKSSLWSKLGAAMLIPSFNRLKKQMDYTEYGGALLLGVNGTVFICHGSSDARAIKNAVRAATNFVVHNVNEAIVESAKAHPLPNTAQSAQVKADA